MFVGVEMAVTGRKKKDGVKAARRHAAKSQWRLRKSGKLQMLQAEPFNQFKWLVHGFSTRPGGVSELKSPRLGRSKKETALNLGFTEWDRPDCVDANRRRFQKALGHSDACLVTLRQVHSDVLHVIREPLSGAPNGDALATQAQGLLLGIQTADCIPILLVDPRHRAVSAVHAGWRGTVARIAEKTVGRMAMEFGTRPKDVLAALGPGIGRCCYEVGPDVVKEFAAQFSDAAEWFDGPFAMLASGEDPNPLPWLTMMPPGHQPPPVRCHLDLHAANSAILAKAGLQRKNIFAADFCTSCRTDLFFSYRREGVTGRMMAVVGVV
jgi:YfiH family protein